MIKRMGLLIICGLFAVSVCGCALLLAGAAGGAGTSVWLSGKLSQEVNVPMEKAVSASKKGLQSLKLSVSKETTKEEVVQLISEYYDGKQIWIDIHRVTSASSRIDVRVGAVGDKDAADKILKKIQSYI